MTRTRTGKGQGHKRTYTGKGQEHREWMEKVKRKTQRRDEDKEKRDRKE